MRKGFIFTLLTALLFGTLFILVAANLHAASTTRVNDLITARKIVYTWDDVQEGIKRLIELNITQDAENLTFADSLPASRDIKASLKAYGLFVNNTYRTSELQIKFLNPSEQEITLDQLNPPIQILPFGINYTYPTAGGGSDWGKRELQIVCDSKSNNCDVVKRIEINFLINDTFLYDPNDGTANQNNYQWSPTPSTSSCSGTAHCVDFTLNVTDLLGRSFYCYYDDGAGGKVDCPYRSFTWSSANAPKIDIFLNQTCTKIFIQFAGDTLITARMLDSNNRLCGTITSTIKLTFNTTDYEVGFLTKTLVRDINYNSSKKL